MKQFVFLFSIILISACSPKIVGGFVGQEFDVKNPISYEQLLTKMKTDGGVTETVVKGKVEAVCQAKGCWMKIMSETLTEDDGMFVKFKDYGFFVPKDLAGKEIIMKGDAWYETTPVEELQHYAEDNGASQEEIQAITEPIMELKFLATGVFIPSEVEKK